MEQAHVVTGATGFVGGALTLELLARTDDPILCLVRPHGDTPPEARLHETLRRAARAYAIDSRIEREIDRRCHAVPAVLDRDDPARLAEAVARPIGQVWHCAASLRYRERERGQVERTNVVGTHNLLAMADLLAADAFHYMSTAYVVGDRQQDLREAPVVDGRWNNVYEETKAAAENLVLAATGMRTTVLRPSVVVGHSVTQAVSGSLTGVYGLAMQLFRFAHERCGPLDRIRLRLDPSARLNLVHVDSVAAAAVGCGLTGRSGTVFNITGAQPQPVEAIVRSLCAQLDLPAPLFVGPTERLTAEEEKLHERLAFYGTYLVGNRTFDRRNMDTALTAYGLDFEEVSEPTLDRLFAWYSEHSRPVVPTKPEPERRRIVFVGGGYTTLLACRRLLLNSDSDGVDATIVAPNGTHHFHGWTNELISGLVHWKRQVTDLAEACPNATVLDGHVVSVDLTAKTVLVQRTGHGGCTTLHYDELILGHGSTDTDHVPGLSRYAWSPKNPEHIGRLRAHLLTSVAGASDTDDEAVRSVAVVGGGLAGAETCAAVADLLVRVTRDKALPAGRIPRVYLLHAGPSILPELDGRYSRIARYAMRQLRKFGIDVRTDCRVAGVRSDGVVLADGTMIPAATVISTLGQTPVALPGLEALPRWVDGRIRTDEYLRVPGHPHLWAGGDIAAVPHRATRRPCPTNALWAIKHGAWIGENIVRDAASRRLRRFSYLGLGRVGSFGVGKGIAHVYGIQFTGWAAWLLRLVFFLRFMPSRRQAMLTVGDLLTFPYRNEVNVSVDDLIDAKRPLRATTEQGVVTMFDTALDTRKPAA